MERKEIFRDRKSIEEFGVDTNNTINKALFDVLCLSDYISNSSFKEEEILGLFNDTYYICTLILVEKRPYFKVNKYTNIASGHEGSHQPIYSDKSVIIMSMVSVYLSSLDVITDDIEKTVQLIRSDYRHRDTVSFERIASIRGRNNFAPTRATEFFPLHFPEKEECSKFWETYRQFPGALAKIVGMIPTNDEGQAEETIVAEMEAKMAKLTEQAAQREKNIAKLITENEKLKRRAEELEIQYKIQMSSYQEKMEKKWEERLMLEAQGGDSHAPIPQLDEVKRALEESQKRNELSQKQIDEMEKKINMLRDKLGTKTISLQSLAEGVKRYAKLYGINDGKYLLRSLSCILQRETVWTDNVEDLENFFIQAEEENNRPLLTLENNQGGVVQITGN